jgi:hypothetical protein
MVKKILATLKEVVLAYLTQVIPLALLIGAITGASFLIWKPFSSSGLSERMVILGLGIAAIAGFLVFGQTTGGRNFGVPGQFISTAHARTLTDWNQEIRRDIVTRFDFRFRLFMTGLTVLGLGILVDVLFT